MEAGLTADLILQWSKVVIPAVTVFWVIYRYFREGFYRPRIEFDLECNIVGTSGNDYLVEFVALADNKGSIRFTFRDLQLRVRGISGDKQLDYLEKTKRVKFPALLFEESLIPGKYQYYFVEPGVRQPISVTTKIPMDTRFVLVHAAFKYRRRWKLRLCPSFRLVREKHTREKTFALRPQDDRIRYN